MKQYSYDEFLPLISPVGRTTTDPDRNAFVFNWTCSGFDVRFTGTVLKAKMFVIGNKPMLPPGMAWDGSWEYANIGVLGEDRDTLVRRIECSEDGGWYTLWEADQPGTYSFRVIKLSENFRGRAGLLALETDGTVESVEPERKKLSIEVVGDSITCGYGNESTVQMGPFLTKEENGWIAYAALAARELNADLQCMCVSGIAVSKGKRPFFADMPCMEQLYAYTDACYDKEISREPIKWDFPSHKKDVVVINLGTNDANPIRFSPSYENAMEEEQAFLSRYRAFIEQVRELNGPDTWICCTLGSMDYYLFDQIRACVEAYQAETGDKKICCFKYIGINMMTEGFGSAGHPSAKTHVRMGRELAYHIRQILGDFAQ